MAAAPSPATRPARLAGTWYPSDAHGCLSAFEGENASAAGRPGAESRPAAPGSPESLPPALFAVAPHAGLSFCGGVQGAVWRGLAALRESIGAVVILSPSHYQSLRAGELVASPWRHLRTPFGELTGVGLAGLDRDGREAAALTAMEHGIELMLPGLAWALGSDTPVASVVVGPLAGQQQAGEAALRLVAGLAPIEERAGERSILFLASSDFTHYGARFRHEPLGEATREVATRVLRADRGVAGLAAAGDMEAYWEAITAAPSTICGRFAIAVAREIASDASAHLVGWGASVDSHWSGGPFVDYVGIAPLPAAAVRL